MSRRWSADEFARLLAGGQVRVLGDTTATPPALSEEAWQLAIMRLLHQHGYAYCYHTWNSRRSPSGFPDLIAVHHLAGRKLLAIELKTDVGQVTPAQQAWLEALAGCTGVVAEVWRPAQLSAIVERLRR
jgi:hypothetical protein